MTQNKIFNIEEIRKDFPALSLNVYDKPLTFLDSAASSQKPQIVIDTMKHCYEQEYANIHRGVYYLSSKATKNFENARKTVHKFINSKEDREIIFVRNGTEAINLVAYSWGRKFLKKDDEIIISNLEHHANIVPWQVLRDEIGIKLKVIPINDDGEIIFDEYKKLLSNKTKLVAITHTSNAIGTITPIKQIIDEAHNNKALVLIDGCQSAQHLKIDVQDIDADFFVASGHKLYGPSSIGFLYAKANILEQMVPYQTGGDMILSVTFEKTEYNVIPHKFEAGTPAIIEAVGLAKALDYINQIGHDNIYNHEQQLLSYATERLNEFREVKFFGKATNKAAIISFNFGNVHAHDVGTILDRSGVAVRTGHHCAYPLMQRFNIQSTARASIGLYNNKQDIDNLITALIKVKEIFCK